MRNLFFVGTGNAVRRLARPMAAACVLFLTSGCATYLVRDLGRSVETEGPVLALILDDGTLAVRHARQRHVEIPERTTDLRVSHFALPPEEVTRQVLEWTREDPPVIWYEPFPISRHDPVAMLVEASSRAGRRRPRMQGIRWVAVPDYQSDHLEKLWVMIDGEGEVLAGIAIPPADRRPPYRRWYGYPAQILLPATVAFDVVTFPVQAMLFLRAMGQSLRM